MTRKHSLPLLFVATLSLSACSSKRVGPETYTGFLHDYSVLTERQAPSGQTVLSWVSPAVKRGRYTQVYLAPSQFYPHSEPTERIPLSTLSGVTDYYDAALRTELAKVLPLVNKPGPNTLVVKPAITQVTASTQGLRFYEWLPVTLVAAGVSTATGIRDQDSEVATEVSFEDGSTGEVVAEVVRKGTGHVLENDKQVLTADDVKAVLDGWATDLRQSYIALGRPTADNL
ncbi:DUF3313 domain-containing protein [Pseudomonas vancouverensis]|uniref:DUF3313 domain-containing protein n=1 Tax=Pseudomonas vancouverensis TaxID=95300 RepID=A0A1H2NFN7_PSEVA|nr:DUF3313 domain-containing protein [Pseudomonas vancouverensis]KAB0494312.1 DUF3313 domain-containing protein [Pseudomonas vancouverensis]TDB60620.1 DUF3313 domain-containing protein [Pseudomonas vancouverensis]SDV04243.1 Protein of unknown function [Pseudomonas vancouverensis]